MSRSFKEIPIDIYSSILIHNPDPIFLLDESGTVLDVNIAASEIFGYSRSEWAEVRIQDIIYPESINDIVHLFAQSLNGVFCSSQVSAYDYKGKLLHLQVKLIPLFNDVLQYKKIMIVVEDQTELIETRIALQKTAEQLRFFYESSAEAMDIIDLDGNVVQVNRAFEEMYGWTEEEIVGTPMPTIPVERMGQVKRDRARVMNNQSVKGLEVECYKKDGTLFPVSITLSPLHDEHGNVIAFSGISRDISERKRFEEALKRSEEKYRLIAENMTDLVIILDDKGVIHYASPSVTPVLGFTLDYFEGENVANIIHSDDLREVQKQFQAIFHTKGSSEVEFRYKHKTKKWIWFEVKGSYFVDEKNGEEFVLVVSRVIEEKKMLREKLTQMAFHDELTGLPNRRLFQEIARQTMKEAKRNKEKCALLFMDIDKFKWVNDTFGHSVGDEFLKRFSDRIKLLLRESDVFARQSGDEFLALLPNTDENEAAVIAERIIECIQKEWLIGNHAFITTSSIGIAIYPSNGTSLDRLIANADNALYKAKENGRNTFAIYS